MSERLAAVLAALSLAACASSSQEARSPAEASEGRADATGGYVAPDASTGMRGGDLSTRENVFGKRPYAVYDPPEDREVSIDAGSWRVAVRTTPRQAAEPADGWVRIADRLGDPAGPEGPRTIRSIDVGEGVHAFLYLPRLLAAGRTASVPLLVLNFRPEPIEVMVALRTEGPIETLPAASWTVRIEAGRAEVVDLEARPTAGGLARLHVLATLEGAPVPAWQSSEVEVSP